MRYEYLSHENVSVTCVTLNDSSLYNDLWSKGTIFSFTIQIFGFKI